MSVMSSSPRSGLVDRALRVAVGGVLMFAVAVSLALLTPGVANAAPCDTPIANPVACENTKPGTENWRVAALDDSIAGYTTDISALPGQSVNFKIKTDASAYRVDIFRLGWYGDVGARQIGTLTRNTAQTQPECLREESTALIDCGNWAVSLTWAVPADAVSGLYYARLHRNDTGGENEIAFVVRSDSSASKVVFQTSDATWQAYNRYGGASLYVGDGPGKDGSAYKVSYNRPLIFDSDENFIFNAEFPMLRFLERNGYDVSYTTGVDTARRGDLIRNHDVFMAVGHDEYWSNEQRANVEAARDAGVHLAFLTGNEIFWKTRWEPSIDSSATDWRTMVCYKETKSPQVDPSPEWTGTWRDPRFSPPKDGGRPENALLGNIFTVNGRRDDALQVPASFGRMRLWRGTDLASMADGAVHTFAPGTLGYEWNTVEDNGFQPSGVAQFSRTTVDLQGPFVLQNYGDVYGPQTKTHALTMYRAASGALVFGAGTVQWAWGVDDDHTYLTGSPTSDPRIQQATVNLLADMGVQPGTLQAGLQPATASTDTSAPTVGIDPMPSAPRVGAPITVTGTVADSAGRVGGVEISSDAGVTWHPANWTVGQPTWSYTFTPAASGSTSIKARAVDDSINLSAPVTLPITIDPPQCPCGIWAASATPGTADTNDSTEAELGVKWRSSSAGFVRGVRFYKGPGNTGEHTGSLWSTGGERLATGTFSNETSTGWQTLQFPTPVAVAANTTYVVSYHTTTGHYSSDMDFFKTGGAAQEPLTALRSGIDGANGVYRVGPSGFPDQSYRDTNYWVDVVWAPDPGPDTRAPVSTGTSPLSGAGTVRLEAAPSVTFDEAMAPASAQWTVTPSGGAPVAGSSSLSPDGRTATFTPSAPLAPGTQYAVTLAATDVAGNPLSTPVSWTFTTGNVRPADCPCTVWDDFAVPAVPAAGDTAAVELGTKVRFDRPGDVLGVRFYKGLGNGGTHTGSLWSTTGERLATGTFAGESTTGWQTLVFDEPVPVRANTSYVVSYLAPTGQYSLNPGGLATGVDAGLVHALGSGVDGPNGLFKYGSAGGFPDGSFNAGNYWVDVIYRAATSGDITPPEAAGQTPAPGATGVIASGPLTVTFNKAVDPASVQLTLTDPGAARLSGNIAVSNDGLSATWTPSAPLAPLTTYTAAVTATGVNGMPMPQAHTWSFTTDAGSCPCSLFSAASQPAVPSMNDPGPIEVGVRFTPAIDGKVTGVRFYKGTNNTGSHTGSLWNAAGQRLATGTFTNETDTGWQTLVFATPPSVIAGTTYTASYSSTTGFYAADAGYFQRTAVNSPPLSASATGANSPNGVYRVGAGFPTSTYQGGNYWVDVVFAPGTVGAPPSVTARTPDASATNVPVTSPVTATFGVPVSEDGAEIVVTDPRGARLAGDLTRSADQKSLTWTAGAALAPGTTYTVRVRAADLEGNAMPDPDEWSFTTGSANCPCSLFSAASVPQVPAVEDSGSYELGVRFTPVQDGLVTGVRFYKGPGNTGAHTGSLWGAAGEQLATGAFVNESASGWQTLVFANPVVVTAGTTYTASYTTGGSYSADPGYFASGGVTTPALAAPAGTNGVYGVGPGFPTSVSGSANYWVDPVFTEAAG